MNKPTSEASGGAPVKPSPFRETASRNVSMAVLELLCRMTHAQILAELMDHAHAFTLAHVARLRDTDLHHRFTVAGTELNSTYWIVAHLAVSQNWLILRATDGPFQKFSWAKHFSKGSTPPPADLCPSFEEVLSTYEAIHRLSMEHVRALDGTALATPHNAMMKLDGGDDVRTVIMHHIRHEGIHNGHLGWLCKLHGLPTI